METTKEKTLVTRFKEVRVRISDTTSMVGKMLAESVKRKWTEDFVDEDTGEIVPVERYEIIIERGKVLTKENVAKIAFFQQEGSVEDVLVTNQDRPASYDNVHYGYFEVVATSGKNKKRLLIYAVGIPMAMQIAIDYCEQTFDRDFRIDSIKLGTDLRVIHFNPKDNDEAPTTYYTVTVTHYDLVAQEYTDSVFLTLAKDADTAIAIIRAVIDGNEKNRDVFGDNYIITVSKTSPITDVVPDDFCAEYISYAKAHNYLMDGQRFGQEAIC
ncbi:MAG: hypothetical protein IJ640_00225 [Prevotella sp.]|nr:hypothetical protein [Prevotella sp.]